MPNPLSYPLGNAVIQDNVLTVDAILKAPHRITQRMVELTQNSFVIDKVFGTMGAVGSHAVQYMEMQPGLNEMDGSIPDRAPGEEVKVLTAEWGEAKVSSSRDFSGRFFVPDEAITRNQASLIDAETTRLSNKIVMDVNRWSVDTFEKSALLVSVSGKWGDVILDGATPTSPHARPSAHFAQIQSLADVEEMGITYDLYILNPADAATLRTVYGDRLKPMLDTFGISLFPTNRVEPGTAFAVASGEVGFCTYETALSTVVYRAEDRKGAWVQTSVKPIIGVVNPYAIRSVGGFAN